MERTKVFTELKALLLDLLPGYPNEVSYGKVQFYLKSGEIGVDLLDKHKIIEKLSKEEIGRLSITEEEKKEIWYRLAPKGVDLAISMINLKQSERVLNYSKQMKCFTIAIIVIGGLALLVGITHIILSFSI